MPKQDKFRLKEKRGGRPVYQWDNPNGRVIFLIDKDNDWINIQYIRSEKSGVMKMMIDTLVEVYGINHVRFISPLDDRDKEVIDAIGDELEKLVGLPPRKDMDNNHKIDERVDYYAEVEEEYYDGETYKMLLAEWEK